MKTKAAQIKTLIFVVLFSSWSWVCTSSYKKPHIIFILADDLGWNDVSFHGSYQIPTPNIDALARDGVVLNNYYVQPLCTPSRGALMTGKYPIHLGLQHDVIHAAAPWGLPVNVLILPQYLRQLGYKTQGIGKWHLGFFEDEYLPSNRGFDSYFGYWTGKGDFYTHIEADEAMSGLDLHDDVESSWGYIGYYSTELFTAKAKNIIKSHNESKPLFLYLAHQAVHTGNSYTPFQAPTEYNKMFYHIKDQDRQKFAGVVSALDFSIGEIFVALSEAGMLENSIIIFSSDNGAAVEGIDSATGSNWPLRGSKYTLWDGSIRAVGLVWSHLIRNRTRVSNTMMHITDWLPTIYSAAGGDVRDIEGIDGFNQWPSIHSGTPSLRQDILHNIDPIWNMESIRKHNYKLIKGSYSNGTYDGWFDQNGKETSQSVAITEQDKLMYNQVYSELMKKSAVANILWKKYGKNIFANESKTTASTEDSNYCSSMGNEHNCNIGDNDEVSSDESMALMYRTYSEHFQVECGEVPEDVSTNCDPAVAACLFDIEKDPCEYSNLASTLPKIRKTLEDALNRYRETAVPPLNQPDDPKANPKYHGYAWIPWRS